MRELFIANWKMNKTVEETVSTLDSLKNLLREKLKADVAVAPPFTSIHPAAAVLQGTQISLAAQNVYCEDKGAYTGEISALMLKELEVRYVIVGHSERRQYFRETDEQVSKKAKKVLDAQMTPVLCIGETKSERDAGKTFEVLDTQLKGSLQGTGVCESRRIVIAYEPVWAIGTGDTATPQTAQEAHAFIRERLADIIGKELARATVIQYGGSVKPENAASLMGKQDINGALVGGASLDAESFARIVLHS